MFNSLLMAARGTLAQIPADLKGSQDAIMATTTLQNATTMDDIGNAIQSLNKVVPWMQKDPTGNRLVQIYNRVKASWKLPENANETAAKQVPINPEEYVEHPDTYSYTTQSKTQPIESLFNFYFAKLQAANSKSKLKEMISFIPKLEKVLAKMVETSAGKPGSNMLIEKGQALVNNARNKVGLGAETTLPGAGPVEPPTNPVV